jgi:hypothetical protein
VAELVVVEEAAVLDDEMTELVALADTEEMLRLASTDELDDEAELEATVVLEETVLEDEDDMAPLS